MLFNQACCLVLLFEPPALRELGFEGLVKTDRFIIAAKHVQSCITRSIFEVRA